MTDTQQDQTESQKGQKNPDVAARTQFNLQLLSMLTKLQEYIESGNIHNTDSTNSDIDFDPISRDGTTRVHARLTPVLLEWSDENTKHNLFRSREMFVGTCVAFAATHESRFMEYAFKQSYTSEREKMGVENIDVQYEELADTDEHSSTNKSNTDTPASTNNGDKNTENPETNTEQDSNSPRDEYGEPFKDYDEDKNRNTKGF